MVRAFDGDWRLFSGPFHQEDFAESSNWTLLINNIEKHHHEINHLRKLVDFIPTWRFDDIMVSLSKPGGGVGPHFDLYDVFLVQVKGHRSWKIGQDCSASSLLSKNSDLKILSEFEVCEEIITGPYDVLYLPPSKAHWGVAKSESITYSIGFRAPRVNDMIAYWTDEILEGLSLEELYSDKLLKKAERPGEIRTEDLTMAREQILATLMQADTSHHWFGDLITKSSSEWGESELIDTADWTVANIKEASNLAWREDLGKIHIYANGQHTTCSSSLIDMVMTLCKEGKINKSQLPLANLEESIYCVEFLVEIGAAYTE